MMAAAVFMSDDPWVQSALWLVILFAGFVVLPVALETVGLLVFLLLNRDRKTPKGKEQPPAGPRSA